MKSVLYLILFCTVTAAWAQDAPTISANVNLVNLFATVRDRHGHIVNNLKPDDFVLEEDGVPQKIRYFSRESDLPLTVGLLVDTSRSQRGVLNEEGMASATFLNQVLREGKDQAFIVHFDTRVEVLQSLTSARSDLETALQRLTIPGQVATLLFSAVQKSSNDVLKSQSGRKAIVMLTDGVAYKDSTSIETAIEAAQRADVILYAIRFSDPIAPRGPLRMAVVGAMKEHGKEDLKHMTRETGGSLFEVSKNQTIEMIYSQIEDALRNQYSIGYTPPRRAPDGKFHKIRLIAKDRHLVVETRDGYFAR